MYNNTAPGPRASNISARASCWEKFCYDIWNWVLFSAGQWNHQHFGQISLRLFPWGVQLSISQDLFGQWLSTKLATSRWWLSHYMNQCWHSSLINTCFMLLKNFHGSSDICPMGWWVHILNPLNICCSLIKNNHPTRSQFCTCHKVWTDMTCTHICGPQHCNHNQSKKKKNLLQLWSHRLYFSMVSMSTR